jgi:hypothetical protein
MLKIAHRINTISQLQNNHTEYGVELDLRPDGDRMKKGVTKIAVRFSEFEPLEFVMKFSGKVEWV